MTGRPYRILRAQRAPSARDAVEAGDRLWLMCPCGLRRIRLRRGRWSWGSDADGRLLLSPSVARRGADLCHFEIEAGEPRMQADSTCPGSRAAS